MAGVGAASIFLAGIEALLLRSPPPSHPISVRPCLNSHVILPKELAKTLQPKRLLAEAEWRALGVQQSRGWAHYAIHRPEPHILLFRRELGTDPMTGKVRRAISLCHIYRSAHGVGSRREWRQEAPPSFNLTLRSSKHTDSHNHLSRPTPL